MRSTIALLFATVILASCFRDENSAGYEYMPDMYRSPSIEAYVDYGEVRHWLPNDSLKNRLTALRPPFGTVPYSGGTPNSYNLPYHRLADSSSRTSHSILAASYGGRNQYELAKTDKNPLRYTKENVEEGKVIYNRFCDHCHGEKGKGDGMVSNNSEYINPGLAFDGKTDGQMFYSITYGKGVMGSHASQVNRKERWQVINYINHLNSGAEDMPESGKIGENLKTALELGYNNGGTAVRLDHLRYASGSAQLDQLKSEQTLYELKQFLQTHPDAYYQLAGHTDTVGDYRGKAGNVLLSKNRANAVKNYLIAHGIKGSRITAVGYGSSRPVAGASNATKEGREQNRRTEVIIKH